MAPKRKSWIDSAWPWIIRFSGLAIAFWETVFERADRPSLLILATALILGPTAINIGQRY